jgi:hypothetical protein
MNLLFWEMTKIIIKCGRQICRHLSCLYRLQWDPKQSPRHECLKLSYRAIDKCNRGWTYNRKMKSRAWSSDIYGHYWNNVWWMRWFKWSCERPTPHMCWINTVLLCNISGKWRTMPHWPQLPSCSDRTCTHHNQNGRPRLRSREG